MGSFVLLVVGAGALAALETDSVGSFGQGLWWAVSLMATVGFVGSPPTSAAGAVVSVVLMLTGFLLLAFVSAALASLFVKDDSAPFEARERSTDQEILRNLVLLQERLTALESRLDDRSSNGNPGNPEQG